MKPLRPTTALTLAACVALVGCRTSAPPNADSEVGAFGWLKKPLEWGAESEEPRKGVPERVVATWVDTVRQQAGAKPERGFGGRVYFYDRGADPILVNGRLVVYAFDETGRAATDHKPTRRYVFPADRLARHMSETEIGTSYSVWLPWGGTEGPTTNVSLIARFEPTDGGGLIVSDQTRQRLPGRDVLSAPGDETLLASPPERTRVRQAAFDEAPAEPAPIKTANAEPAEPRRRLSTTTIRRR